MTDAREAAVEVLRRRLAREAAIAAVKRLDPGLHQCPSPVVGCRRCDENDAATVDAVLAAVEPLIRADAWDEGFNEAYNQARFYGHTDHWEDEPHNPYRPIPTTPAAPGPLTRREEA